MIAEFFSEAYQFQLVFTTNLVGFFKIMHTKFCFLGIEHQKFYYVQLITIHQLTSGLSDALPVSYTQNGHYFQVIELFPFKYSICVQKCKICSEDLP